MQEQSNSNRGSASPYFCPECGQAVPSPQDPSENLLVCPACRHQFYISLSEEISEEISPGPPPRRRYEKAGDLGARAHSLAAGRQGLIRVRSYFIIAALGCFVGIGQIGYLLATQAYGNEHRIGFCLLIAFALYGILYFTRRSIAITRVLHRPLLGEPTKPPDFGPLGGGKTRMKDEG